MKPAVGAPPPLPRMFLLATLLVANSAAQVDYQSQIQEPIFNEICTTCHGTSGGLNLASYDGLMNEGNHGPVVVPGDAMESNLVLKILPDPPFGSRMPKDDQTYFDSHQDQLQTIIDWINEGASETISLAGARSLPRSFSLERIFPNPFNATATIGFALPSAGAVTADILSITGRTVYSLTELRSAGRHAIRWAGQDNAGRELPSGVYLCRLRFGGREQSRRVLLLR